MTERNGILVTGGAGFVGSAVVRLLIARGESVVNVDCLTYAGNLDSLGDALASPRHHLEAIDVADTLVLPVGSRAAGRVLRTRPVSRWPGCSQSRSWSDSAWVAPSTARLARRRVPLPAMILYGPLIVLLLALGIRMVRRPEEDPVHMPRERLLMSRGGLIRT